VKANLLHLRLPTQPGVAAKSEGVGVAGDAENGRRRVVNLLVVSQRKLAGTGALLEKSAKSARRGGHPGVPPG